MRAFGSKDPQILLAIEAGIQPRQQRPRLGSRQHRPRPGQAAAQKCRRGFTLGMGLACPQLGIDQIALRADMAEDWRESHALVVGPAQSLLLGIGIVEHHGVDLQGHHLTGHRRHARDLRRHRTHQMLRRRANGRIQ
jgi:hypothetical protein